MRGQVAGFTDSARASQGRQQRKGDGDGGGHSPSDTSNGGRSPGGTAHGGLSLQRSPAEMSSGGRSPPRSPREVRKMVQGQNSPREVAYGGVVPCSPLAVSRASSSASTGAGEVGGGGRDGSGSEWAMTLHVIEARNLPHSPSSGVFACASLLASPATGGSAPMTLPEHAIELQPSASEGVDGLVSPQLMTPSAHQSPVELRVVWNSAVRLGSFLSLRANDRGAGGPGGGGWRTAPLRGQPGS